METAKDSTILNKFPLLDETICQHEEALEFYTNMVDDMRAVVQASQLLVV